MVFILAPLSEKVVNDVLSYLLFQTEKTNWYRNDNESFFRKLVNNASSNR